MAIVGWGFIGAIRGELLQPELVLLLQSDCELMEVSTTSWMSSSVSLAMPVSRMRGSEKRFVGWFRWGLGSAHPFGPIAMDLGQRWTRLGPNIEHRGCIYLVGILPRVESRVYTY